MAADAAVEGLLERALGPLRSVDRQPHPSATSWPLERIRVELADGSRLDLVLKDLSREALSPEVRRAKPDFLDRPSREIDTYRLTLAPAALGTAAFHGADGSLLLLEEVEAVELWQVGELETWCAVARWLAAMHERLAGSLSQPHLLRYDSEFLSLWLGRAEAFRGPLGIVATWHGRAVERLVELPLTVIHGELYPSNVLVQGARICPVDWELAGSGPALLDLAALTTGWGEREQAAIVAAYGDVPAYDLDCCRLHLAVRWLGWSQSWTPPAAHAHDWLAEARTVAARLAAC